MKQYSTRTLIITTVMITSMLVGFGGSDLAQDRDECTNQLIALSPCLPYVGGDAKAPTKDCCGGFGQVIVKSVKCVCILIKDKDDPNLGLKFNATLAAYLPTACHITAPNITKCISLLHLSPNSTLAREFESLGRIEGNANSTSPSQHVKDGTGGGKAESVKSTGEKKKKSWLAVELLIFALFSPLFNVHLL
ncbi:hypothetical protein EUTSA_v10011802mg [Eutrema salsugineum]|uniref:Bifunctional inhibitor/plant lipid transfer protein/seed storage helical domain-containing protein n=1 Tax=Eutrema salsugineum TaxID=72664 RepID=V4MF96_EUTSA|nr:protein YLS3 [Eutrema salsugineum]ESQ29951.1 hypothetical protein EUTSA_v10011802mg [Eutrema salsugineum]